MDRTSKIIQDVFANTSLRQFETDLSQLHSQIDESEQRVPGIKPDNQARIVWAEAGTRRKTLYSLVYLHGLTACQADGAPIHTDVARRYGYNLYLSRLHGHGIESVDALCDLTPENFLESAVRAVNIGQAIGERVILMASSAGAMLALIIASQRPEIAGLVLYSPMIDFRRFSSAILTFPFGRTVARLLLGGNRIETNDPEDIQRYWNSDFRIEALCATKRLIRLTMNRSTFAKVCQPLFVGYYFKNAREQDERVSVSRILEMFGQTGTPEHLRRLVAFPDARCHAIGASLLNKDIDVVRRATYHFVEEVLGLPRHAR